MLSSSSLLLLLCCCCVVVVVVVVVVLVLFLCCRWNRLSVGNSVGSIFMRNCRFDRTSLQVANPRYLLPYRSPCIRQVEKKHPEKFINKVLQDDLIRIKTFSLHHSLSKRKGNFSVNVSSVLSWILYCVLHGSCPLSQCALCGFVSIVLFRILVLSSLQHPVQRRPSPASCLALSSVMRGLSPWSSILPSTVIAALVL